MCSDRHAQLLDKEWACLNLAIQCQRQYLREMAEDRVFAARRPREALDGRAVSLMAGVGDKSARQLHQHEIENAMQVGPVVFFKITYVDRIFFEVVRCRPVP